MEKGIADSLSICGDCDTGQSAPGNNSGAEQSKVMPSEEISIYGLEDPAYSIDDSESNLLYLLAMIRQLDKKGYRVSYYAMSTKPEVFLQSPMVMELSDKMGDEAFPLTLYDNVILKQGNLPDEKDFFKWLGVELDVADIRREAGIQAVLACERIRSSSCDGGSACAGCSGCYMGDAVMTEMADNIPDF